MAYSYVISVRSCAAGRIRARHPVIDVVRPVGTCTLEGRLGARGIGTCLARDKVPYAAAPLFEKVL